MAHGQETEANKSDLVVHFNADTCVSINEPGDKKESVKAFPANLLATILLE